MERREKLFRIASYVFGGIGAALLVAILVMKILRYDIMWWTLPLVAAVILFLITDEQARRLKRKRLAAEAKADGDVPSAPQETLPNEAFVFDDTKQEKP